MDLDNPDLEGEERFARIRSRSEKFSTSRSGRERSKSRSLVRMSFVTGEVFRDSNNYYLIYKQWVFMVDIDHGCFGLF